MIHVAYRLWGGDGFFAKMCGTSMLSMFENTKEKVTVHIMHNERLTPDNRGKFCYIAGQYNQRVEFHNVEEIAGTTLRKFEAVHPNKSGRNSSWYPLIVHEVFPDLDKLICLGADTIIKLDIAELWEYDLDKLGVGFAAVPEVLNGTTKRALRLSVDGYVNHEDYFNADVLLVKPKFFQENFERVLEGCKFIYDNKYPYLEQDALNYVFSKEYFKLPRKFNAMIRRIRDVVDKGICHYAGGEGAKPSLNTDNVYDKLYLEYFLKTPWATADMFGNIDKAFRRQYDRLKTEFLRYTNLLYNRERLFLIDKSMTEKMRKIFAIRDDETIIDASDSAAMDKFFETLDELKGKKLIYLLSNNYKPVEDRLHKIDFLGGRDYVNAFIFLSAKDGGRFVVYDSKAVVREM